MVFATPLDLHIQDLNGTNNGDSLRLFSLTRIRNYLTYFGRWKANGFKSDIYYDYDGI